ncbi:hypothetical protein JY97_08070 [Alkalispirochaeta odontotermitis]|nr:hypothetical protein JY97_08070 [Alkalispirochaeta odontotermitis]CAB1082535.1 hypothetical protein D1AOALGA4SA_10145 [Olavius algarvensis Delta 1 endosymbiont]
MISSKYIANRKWPTLTLAAILVLLLSALGFDFSLSTVPSSAHISRLINQVSATKNSDPFGPDNLQPNTASHTPLFFAGHDEEKPLVPLAVVEFLKTYSLSKFENAFFDALRFRQFKRVTEEIYRSTGYELIRLDHVPGFVRKTHVVLSHPLGAEGQDAHFLFWRPLFRMNKFYYTYKGHDIFFLQKKLAALELYDRVLDGVVGPELLYAVVQFQKQMSLQLTGYPDPSTLFLICQLVDKSENSLIDETL